MTAPRTIRVLSVDDHAFLAEGLRARLDVEPDMELVGRRSDAADLVGAVQETEARIVLLDIEMPGPDPFEAVEDLRRRCPDTRVVMLSAYVRDHYLDAAYAAGAWGYLCKSDPSDAVIEGIRRVAAGELAFSPQVLERAPGRDGAGAAPRIAEGSKLHVADGDRRGPEPQPDDRGQPPQVHHEEARDQRPRGAGAFRHRGRPGRAVRGAMNDALLEMIRAALLAAIIGYLVIAARRRSDLSRPGWRLILAGFGLLLFASLLDITDEFEGLGRWVVIGDTPVQAGLEKIVGFLGGFMLLAIGLVRWIPTVASMERVERLGESLAEANRELEAALAVSRRAEHTVSETREERDRFFNLTSGLLCIAGTDGYFKRLNPAWERTLGFTEEELCARPFVELVHPDDRASTLAEIEKLGRGLDTVYFENRYLCEDGSYRWLLWACPAPLPGETRLYAAARDITELKEATAEIRQAKDATTPASTCST
ncbi:MAG: PAS domain S-box protein [Planctomycetota bacterium]|jgi:PAS domain S-box-containing protein